MAEVADSTKKITDAAMYLESTSYRCPCCDAVFNERRIKPANMSPIGYDSDLRPHYQVIDPILYGVILCRRCGYAALSKTFDNLSFVQAQAIMSRLPSAYKNMEFPLVYTEDIAIIRYKTALRCALLSMEKSGELAYLYMRLAWIYRAKGDVENERKMLRASFEGFLEAEQIESFPVIDLSKGVVYYTMGDFLCRLSKENRADYFFKKALETDGLPEMIKKFVNNHTVFNRQ